MKRFLSILLIAAAVFGIYNDYLNIMDVLACKTYWEDESDQAETDLNKLGIALNRLGKSKKAYQTGSKQVANGKKSLKNYKARYKAAGDKLALVNSKILQAEDSVKQMDELVKAIYNVRTAYVMSFRPVFTSIYTTRNAIIKDLFGPAPDGNNVYKMLYLQARYLPKDKRKAYRSAVKGLYIRKKDLFKRQTAADYRKYAENCGTVSKAIDSLEREAEKLPDTRAKIASYDAEQLRDALADPKMYDQTVALMQLNILYEDDPVSIVKSAAEGDEFDLGIIIDYASESGTKNEIKSRTDDLKMLQYYITDRMKAYAKDTGAKAEKLVRIQNKIAPEVSDIASKVLSDSKLSNGVRTLMGDKALTVLKAYAKKDSPLTSKRSNLAVFYYQMSKKPNLDGSLQKMQSYLTRRSAAYKKAIAVVKTKYDYNMKTYDATPAKLKAAKQKIVTAQKKLKAYIKSEKEIKSGLETLTSKEAQGNNESVKDRLDGDVNFDTQRGHLNITKGNKAVEAGKAYLTEQGELVTKEITGRIIATVMGIISAALALLAALLSLLRSNRGAAVVACIAAVVAAGAAVTGNSTSSVYSELAGSQIGDMPWIAAAVIAGIAMAFAAMHFAAKIEDPLVEEE